MGTARRPIPDTFTRRRPITTAAEAMLRRRITMSPRGRVIRITIRTPPITTALASILADAADGALVAATSDASAELTTMEVGLGAAGSEADITVAEASAIAD